MSEASYGEVRLQNFKSHIDTEIELDRFTVLVGPNSCGKTSVLEALHYISQLAPPRTKEATEIFGGSRLLGSLCRVGTESFRLMAQGPPQRMWRFQGTMTKRPGGWSYERDWRAGTHRLEDDQSIPGLTSMLSFNGLRSAVFLKLNAKDIATPSLVAPERIRVRHTGYGVATVLANMKLRDDEAFDAVTEDLSKIVPTIRRLKINQSIVKDRPCYELLADLSSGKNIPANRLSEGTLIALGIITALHSSARPRLLLLDDLQQALHPLAQIELVRFIKRMLELHPDLQVVATTHSPYVLDELEPKSVWVLALDDDGATHSARLSQHPDADRALKVLTTGEFWSTHEESWVKEFDDGSSSVKPRPTSSS